MARKMFEDILTPEDKAKYSTFAHKVHELSDADIHKLNLDMADTLTSEMKDIVSWEIRLRQMKMLKDRNIDLEKMYSVDKKMQEARYAEDDPNLMAHRIKERAARDEMSDELLERSKQIIENTYIPIRKDELGRGMGKGINVMMKKILIEDDNGKVIRINNEAIQKKFQREYIKKMSEITGIDYTECYPNFNNGTEDMPNDIKLGTVTNLGNDKISFNPNDNIDMSEYD